MVTGAGPHITLRTMEQFVAVAEELHFHRAAKRLNMSQPPLTNAIRKLEDDLGVVLVTRGNRVLGLTAAGHRLVEQARETLRQAALAITTTLDVAAGRTGVVRLGYVGSALYGRLPDEINRFRDKYPMVRLELREATTAVQLAGLRDGQLDIGITVAPLWNAADVVQCVFDQDRLCLALPAAHPLCAKEQLDVADLAQEPFILWPIAEGQGFHLQVIRLCAQAGFVPKIAQEAHGMHTVLSLVAVGAGVSVVPQSMRGFRNDRISYRPLPDAEAAFDLVLAHRGLTPAAQTFMQMCQTITA